MGIDMYRFLIYFGLIHVNCMVYITRALCNVMREFLQVPQMHGERIFNPHEENILKLVACSQKISEITCLKHLT